MSASVPSPSWALTAGVGRWPRLALALGALVSASPACRGQEDGSRGAGDAVEAPPAAAEIAAPSAASEPASARPLGPATVQGRLRRASGAGLEGWSAGLADGPRQPIGADARYALVVPEWRRGTPALSIAFGPEEGPEIFTRLPLPRVPEGDLDFVVEGEGPRLSLRLESPPDRPLDPALVAWVEVSAWIDRGNERWAAAEDAHAHDPEAFARAEDALFAELALEIEGDPDPERRALREVGQFIVGASSRSELRRDAARKALAAHPTDDPKWAFEGRALAVALTAAGLYEAKTPAIDELIRTSPSPDLAAYFAVERYMSTASKREWAAADAVWAAFLARPELARTGYGEILVSLGPNRPLAPGNKLEAICGVNLEGAARCLPSAGKLTVVDLWASWCVGCVESMPAVADAAAKLAADGHDVDFVALNLHEDGATIAAFARDRTIAGEVVWIDTEEGRGALRKRLALTAIPQLALLAGDGRVLASSPALQPEGLVAEVGRWASEGASR